MNLDEKIKFWKNRLLDLSRKNRLVHSPISNTGTRISRISLQVQNPNATDLWKRFADDGTSLIFSLPAPDNEEMNDIPAHRRGIITNQNPKDTQKTLLNLKQKARLFTEEKGLHALHLAFCFLCWREGGDNGQECRSPLLLVPVQLSQENFFSPFVLSRHDDEIVSNYVLAQRLLNDFNIRIPEYNNEIGLDEYSDTIRKICAPTYPRWEISFDVELSLYSFLKINMYHDVEKNASAIKEHPIIRVISGDATAISNNKIDIAKFDHDTVEPKDDFSIVDADSSQQDAILLAKQGISFVLQGPPGTGKSQTITNIIAELLSDGKRVLFVSEKMAALEVVYKRLSKAGLNDFCLALHSHNAKRREVLDQLERLLKLAQNDAKLSEEAFHQLYQLKHHRKQLNDYPHELHSVFEPLGKAIYYANGKIAALSGYPNISYTQAGADTCTPSELAERLSLIEDLSRIVAESGYQCDNPWLGCTITTLTNQFRQQFSIDAKRILELFEDGFTILDAINSDWENETEWSHNDILSIINALSIASSSPHVPFEWTLLDFVAVQKHLSNLQKLHRFCDALQRDIEDAHRQESVLQNRCDNAHVRFTRQKVQVSRAEAAWLIERDKYSTEYDDTIFDLDACTLYNDFRTKYNSVFRLVRSDYRADRDAILNCRKKAGDLSFADVLSLLQSLDRAQRLRETFERQRDILIGEEEAYYSYEMEVADIQVKIKELEYALGKQVNAARKERKWLSDMLGIVFDYDTDYDTIEKQLLWISQFVACANSLHFSETYVKNICACHIVTVLRSAQQRDRLSIWNEQMQAALIHFIDLFDESQVFLDLPLVHLKDRIKNCLDNFQLLEYLIDFRTIMNKCADLGIDRFCDEAKKLDLDAKQLLPAFEKCFYRSWLDAVLPRRSAVLNFRRIKQEEEIKLFTELDLSHMEISKATLVSKLISRLPAFDTASAAHGELGLLKRELAKQKKFMSTRKLIAALPNLLPILKPCMMMSPLSVSTYLSEDYQFDTVIFDEASQIRTEDAICALFRAKQAIIAGDSKQLPPTDFFNVSLSVHDDEEYDEDNLMNDIGAYESLLDESALLPSQTLLWHYRSRHEHLIAFSNAKIYHGNLTTFPSSTEYADGIGVQYIHVSGGVYDRGGKNGNHAEAERVAELAISHFREYPERSLGIIAFGEAQQSAIMDALIKKRRSDPRFEQFFRDDAEEAIFIKNLETVQGDERDTIILSIGYAPDRSGTFIMNFGPLSRSGGERRLNVAVTRARYNLKLVGSILPTDIDIERISEDGPKLLRLYIDFAMHGSKSILGDIEANDDLRLDSPFEIAVYDFLISNGYDVATQVGCSGYRIDMAVRHPLHTGSYAIGIECDGAAYHMARTARERDRLRQAVLEDMGWTMYRIWSTDWIKNEVHEKGKLIEVIEKAINNCEITPQVDPSLKQMTEYLDVSKRPATEQKLPHSKYVGYKALDIPISDYVEVMLNIITQSYGIEKEGLFKSVISVYGWKRRGSNINKMLDQAFDHIMKSGKISVEDGRIQYCNIEEEGK